MQRRYAVFPYTVLPLPLFALIFFSIWVTVILVVPQLLPGELPSYALGSLWLALMGLQFSGRLDLGDHSLTVSWLGTRARVVRYGDVTAVDYAFRWQQPNHRVIVRRRQARPLIIYPLTKLGAERIVFAIRDRIDIFRRSGPVPDIAMLERGGRSYVAWEAHLRQLGDGGSYRTAGAHRDELWAIAEHPQAPARARIAAAVALSGRAATTADFARLGKIPRVSDTWAFHRAMRLAIERDFALETALSWLPVEGDGAQEPTKP